MLDSLAKKFQISKSVYINNIIKILKSFTLPSKKMLEINRKNIRTIFWPDSYNPTKPYDPT